MRATKIIFSMSICLVLFLSGKQFEAKGNIIDSPSADPAWCDLDGDGHCFIPFGADCDDSDPDTNPDVEELPDLKDNNCSGFEDEPPLGLKREGFTMGGAAGAVEWYGEYIYLAASATMRVYHAPPGSVPIEVDEFEMRDWVREMAVDGDTLFMAARGDGLHAYDLSINPAHPVAAGSVTGELDVDGYSGVESIFNGVDAKNGRVAVARVNNVAKAMGGVDALVYDYDPVSDTFILVKAIGTEGRAKTTTEAPISVGLTADGGGLYIGYGILVGELVYVRLDSPGDVALQADIGAVMDIATLGDEAYVALTGLSLTEFNMLSKITPGASVLTETAVISNTGSGAGVSVDLHDDFLCFSTWSPGRYEEGYNLWVYRDLDEPAPIRVGAAATPDWIYQLSCRDAGSGNGWAYVADEWGGLELWASDGISLTLDLDNHRVPSGALSLEIWSDGNRVYTAKEGAALWYFEDGNPKDEKVAVEWIDTSDPGCSCDGCCPPDVGEWPYPPAVFIDTGLSNQGKVVVTGQDRNTAVAGDAYLMFFEPDGDDFELVYSDPLGPSDPIGGTWGANMLSDDGEIIFGALSGGPLRIYQHCSGETEEVRKIAEVEHPVPENGLEFNDVAVFGDYLFVTERHRPLLGEPDRGMIHVYHWKSGDIPTCPTQPVLLDPIEHLGSFSESYIPFQMQIDQLKNQLYVGCTSKRTFPIVEGAVHTYDLATFDPENIASLDSNRNDLTPTASIRVTHANVHDLYLDGDNLYIIDRDNGLYLYTLSNVQIVGFYPAHRGPQTEAYMPREMVQSPEGVVPLYHPVSMAMTPSGKLVVQEHVTGRVSIFSVERRNYLPLVLR